MIGLYGGYLGARNKAFELNLIWSFTNAYWLYLAYIDHSDSILLFGLNQIIFAYGVYNLKGKKFLQSVLNK